MEQDTNNFIHYPCEITGPAYSNEVGDGKDIYPIKKLDLDIDKWLLEPFIPPKKKRKKKYKKLVKRINELEARIKKLEDMANTTTVNVEPAQIDFNSLTSISTPVRDDQWITITNNS